MSQTSHFPARISSPLRVRRAPVLLGVLGLAAAAAVVAVVLLFTLGGSDFNAPPSVVSHQPAVRSDGGPSETAVAASIRSRPSAGPSESAIAATVGAPAPRPTTGPDESRIAAAVSAGTAGRP